MIFPPETTTKTNSTTNQTSKPTRYLKPPPHHSLFVHTNMPNTLLFCVVFALCIASSLSLPTRKAYSPFQKTVTNSLNRKAARDAPAPCQFYPTPLPLPTPLPASVTALINDYDAAIENILLSLNSTVTSSITVNLVCTLDTPHTSHATSQNQQPVIRCVAQQLTYFVNRYTIKKCSGLRDTDSKT